jgi:acyl-CoA synthetase (AMP-forming)/AMP-acid ligase II
VHSFNNIYYPLLFLGIIAAGGIFAGTNPGYTQYELVHHVKTAKVRFLISEPEILSRTREFVDISPATRAKVPGRIKELARTAESRRERLG